MDERRHRPATLGELAESGYRHRTVREELRENVVARVREGRAVFEGLVGYEDTVEPEVVNALLAGHHMVLLGERGQAKTRILRSLVGLLDPWMPAVEGCPLRDDPRKPSCAACRRLVSEGGNSTPIAWIPSSERYVEKLATPDVSIADLMGEVDPVRLAEGRHLSDEETIHFGLVPRSHRGIFAINELPDLPERVQVGLFNVMEERDFQIKGFPVRLPLDVLVVASANPEDYTSRGRIITPLKDRFDARIRTHYARTLEHEIAIMKNEASIAPGDRPVLVPEFLPEVVASWTLEARRSSDVHQASGVSARVSINNYETLLANAERRAIQVGEPEVVPRLSDFWRVVSAMAGKIELEIEDDGKEGEQIAENLLTRAVRDVFDRHVDVDSLGSVVQHFETGWGVSVADDMPSNDYLEGLESIPGLREATSSLCPGESVGLVAAAIEFVFEGLHAHGKLSRRVDGGHLVYRS